MQAVLAMLQLLTGRYNTPVLHMQLAVNLVGTLPGCLQSLVQVQQLEVTLLMCHLLG